MPLPEGERKERLPVAERPIIPEIPPEVEHLEIVGGAELTLPKPVTDKSGGVILDNIAPQKVTITLPLTQEETLKALSLKVIYSLRWLAEWTKRLIKMVKGKFLYQFKS